MAVAMRTDYAAVFGQRLAGRRMDVALGSADRSALPDLGIRRCSLLGNLASEVPVAALRQEQLHQGRLAVASDFD